MLEFYIECVNGTVVESPDCTDRTVFTISFPDNFSVDALAQIGESWKLYKMSLPNNPPLIKVQVGT